MIEEEFKQGLVEHYPMLLRFAYQLTRDMQRAQDLVQTTMVKALEKRELFDGGNLKGWLGKVQYNTFVSQLRRKKFGTDYDPGPIIDAQTTQGNQEWNVYLFEMSVELDKLSVEKKSIILDLIQGYTYEELSSKYNRPVGTIRSYLCRIRDRIVLNMGHKHAKG